MTETYCDEAVQCLKVDTPRKDHTCTCTIALDEDRIINLSDIELFGVQPPCNNCSRFCIDSYNIQQYKVFISAHLLVLLLCPLCIANKNINQQLIKIKLKNMPAKC